MLAWTSFVFFFGNGLDEHSQTEPAESFIHIFTNVSKWERKKKSYGTKWFREETLISYQYSTLQKSLATLWPVPLLVVHRTPNAPTQSIKSSERVQFQSSCCQANYLIANYCIQVFTNIEASCYHHGIHSTKFNDFSAMPIRQLDIWGIKISFSWINIFANK